MLVTSYVRQRMDLLIRGVEFRTGAEDYHTEYDFDRMFCTDGTEISQQGTLCPTHMGRGPTPGWWWTVSSENPFDECHPCLLTDDERIGIASCGTVGIQASKECEEDFRLDFEVCRPLVIPVTSVSFFGVVICETSIQTGHLCAFSTSGVRLPSGGEFEFRGVGDHYSQQSGVMFT